MNHKTSSGQESSSFIERFLRQESAAGILLVIAAVVAIIMANSPLSGIYTLLIDTPVAVKVGALSIDKPLLLWINDGLMAVFFLMVGLELKREVLEGELSTMRNMFLPGLGAIGGMVVPAAIYLAFNHDDPQAVDGWAIPAATDIAFALGVLSLLGPRVPTSLKIFLTSLAIFDDLGAIIIIALFYTTKISFTALCVAAISILMLIYCNRRGVAERSPYLIIGLIMWVALLKSGVHATLAGVILALAIPNRVAGYNGSPLKGLEHDLHAAVTFLILPVFAFANSGVDLTGVGIGQLTHNVPLGIALGLFVGKQLGVFAFCWLGIRMGVADLPRGVGMMSLYGASILCGIGFTMSLFIGSLAFEETGVNMIFDERLGIIVGSLLSGIAGYLLLRHSLPQVGRA